MGIIDKFQEWSKKRQEVKDKKFIKTILEKDKKLTKIDKIINSEEKSICDCCKEKKKICYIRYIYDEKANIRRSLIFCWNCGNFVYPLLDELEFLTRK